MADPSDVFLNAYLAFQKGEKLEGAGNAKGALEAYEQAVSLLDDISKQAPNWNPAIVDHRRQKATEGVTRMTPLAGKRTGGGKPKPSEEDVSGPMPGERDEPLLEGTDSFPAPRETQPQTQPRSSGKPGSNPLQEIQHQLDSLQADLAKTKEKLQSVTKEKEDLAKKYDAALKDAEESSQKVIRLEKRANMLEDALVKQEGDATRNSESSKAMKAELATVRKQLEDVRIEREAEAELREQVSSRLAAAGTKIATLTEERDAARKENAATPGRLAAIQKEVDKAVAERAALDAKLTAANAKLATVTAERDAARKDGASGATRLAEMQKEMDKAAALRAELSGKLEKTQGDLAKVQGERDTALQQVAKMKEAQKQVDKLMADNTDLMAKLSEAENQIKTFKASGLDKDKQIAALKGEMAGARQQIADALKQGAAYQAQMSDLQAKLDIQAKELAQLKADATTSTSERKRLMEENELLRGVVVRQMKQQAVRDKTRQLVVAELAKLKINSKALVDQVEFLGQPVVKLTEKEKKLFKQPTIEINDDEISIAAPKELTPAEKAAAAAAEQEAKGNPAGENPPAPVTKPKEEMPADAGLPRVDVTEPAEGKPNPEVATPAPKTEVKNEPKKEKPGTAPMEGELPAKGAASSGGKAPSGGSSGEASLPTTSVSRSEAVSGPALSDEQMAVAQQAKEQFEKGDYREAEKTYEKLLAQAPNNVYVLSNLGVVRFRSNKLKLAEEAFKKAIAISPEDSFSRCTLGIVYYSQGKYDESINELTKALAINPKNATAHNYLGITASQKGWQDQARKALETATTLDPQYADAHFNLAVIYATQQPADKEAARSHYKRATELGAEPDSALEQLLK